MGKRLIIQRRGRGTPAHRVASHRFKDKIRYRSYDALEKEGSIKGIVTDIVHDPARTAPIAEVKFENGEKKRFDFAYITIHGTPGEDGRLQGYFDLIGLPYSSCGMLVSALTFNKYVCNHYLNNFGVRIAKSIRLMHGENITAEEVESKLGLPVFVKPNDGGSSFGVTKVKEISALPAAIDKAFAEGKEVVIESFIEGTEVTCGCYKVKGKEVVFPVTEVVTSNEFFDFDAKYNGQAVSYTHLTLPTIA